MHAMEHSHIVLILLTHEALESHWVTLEILLGLEKSQRSGRMCIRLALYNVTEEQKNSLHGLKLIPFVTLDFNRDNWIDTLVETIQRDIPMSEILPAGNVAHGLVFNYFVGFLQHVLPGLPENIKSMDLYKQNKNKVVRKFLILLPDSCQIKSIVGKFGEFVIERADKLDITSGHGDKIRQYNPAVYRITNIEKESYFFLCECPTIMETMAKLADSNFVGGFDICLQMLRFRQTLEDFVNHKGNIDYNDTVIFVDYNDKKKSHAEEIWKACVCEFGTPPLERRIIRKVGIVKEEPTESKDAATESKYTATVTNIDGPEDKNAADEIMTFLQKNNIQFTNGEGKMGDEYLRDARWNIFVMSKEAVKDQVMNKQLNSATSESITDNQVQVLVILTKGTHIEDVPKKYRWTIMLESANKDYLNILWNTMKGGDTKMQGRWPAGKVYEGLAWAYMLNYLPITLCGKTADGKEFKERFKDAMVKYNTGCKCVARVFVIVPRTCSNPPPGQFFEGEKHLGAIEPAVIGFRKYFLQFYQLTLENGETVCYAREYATPAVTLYEMAHTFPVASCLQLDDMYEQSAQFAKFVKEIINEDSFKKDIGDITDKCTVVYFDDEKMDKQGMTNELKKELSHCLANGDFIAPETVPEAAST